MDDSTRRDWITPIFWKRNPSLDDIRWQIRKFLLPELRRRVESSDLPDDCVDLVAISSAKGFVDLLITATEVAGPDVAREFLQLLGRAGLGLGLFLVHDRIERNK